MVSAQIGTTNLNAKNTKYCDRSTQSEISQSSRPQELPPQSLTEPDVNLSAHPAPIDQPKVLPQNSNGQIDVVRDSRFGQASGRPYTSCHVTSYISASPTSSVSSWVGQISCKARSYSSYHNSWSSHEVQGWKCEISLRSIYCSSGVSASSLSQSALIWLPLDLRPE
jgi:hypothetical protein